MPADHSEKLTRKGEATRSRIVDVTAGLVFDHGVEGTTMESIRDATGVSGSQLSHYFVGKGDLTRSVIAKRHRDVAAYHRRDRFGEFASFDALDAWVADCIADIDTVYRRGGCIYGSLAGELIDGSDLVHQDLRDGYDEWIGIFVDGLTAMKRRGVLRDDADCRHLAVSLVIAHQGGAMLTHITGDPEPLRANLSAAVDYVRSFASK